MRTWIVFFSFFFSCLSIQAKHPYEPILQDPFQESWRWSYFPNLEGRGIIGITETSNHHLWMIVDTGLIQYDGLRWEEWDYNRLQITPQILTLHPTDNNALYIGTLDGLFSFSNGQTQKVFPLSGDWAWPIESIEQTGDGSLWLASVLGLIRIKDQHAVVFTTPDIADMLAIDAPDIHTAVIDTALVPYFNFSKNTPAIIGYINTIRKWVVCGLDPSIPAENTRLQLRDRISGSEEMAVPPESELTLVIQRPDLDTSITTTLQTNDQYAHHDFHIYRIAQGQNNTLWLGLLNGNVLQIQYDAHAIDQIHTWKNVSIEQNKNFGEMPSLFEDSRGTLWIASDARNQKIHNYRDGVIQEFSVPGSSYLNTAIIQTVDGSIWIGGYSSLARHSAQGWKTFRNKEYSLFNNRLIPYTTSDGALWIVGRGQGLIRIDITTNKWLSYQNIIFQCEEKNGDLWFISNTSEIVRFDGHVWTALDTTDGMMDTPSRIFQTSDGTLYVIGSHKGAAALSQRVGDQWIIHTYPDLSRNFDFRIALEDQQGRLWLSSAPDPAPKPGGVLLFQSNPANPEEPIATHLPPPFPPPWSYGIGEFANGDLILGGYSGAFLYSNHSWSTFMKEDVTANIIDSILIDQENNLWMGTRQNGLFVKQKDQWLRYTKTDNLSSNYIKDIYQTKDGSVWVSSNEGIDRFDGQTWLKNALPNLIESSCAIRETASGNVWINRVSEVFFQPYLSPNSRNHTISTHRYRANQLAPETTITEHQKTVSYFGYTFIKWKGTDFWNEDDDLYFSYKINDEPWSAFSPQTDLFLQNLQNGQYTLQVRARDRDFNVDPTPAIIHFSVNPPVWKNPGFLSFISILFLFLCIQTGRLIYKDQRLETANRLLKEAHDDLEVRVKERTRQLSESHDRLKNEIAEREQLEEKLRQSQKMEAIGTLAGGIAHDFNNILTVIQGFSELAKSSIPSDNKAHASLGHVAKASIRAKELVEQILTFSRKAEQQHTILTINSLLKESLKLLRASIPSTIAIHSNIPDHPITINADITQMQQVIVNLCTNAAHAMRKRGGILSITLELQTIDTDLDLPHWGLLKPGAYATLTVRDSGDGIPSTIIPKIFDPFFTTKPKGEGTGMGLSVVHGIVKSHYGGIHVTSAIHEGTTFTVYLPQVKEQSAVYLTAKEELYRGHGERLLLVDDEEAIIDLFTFGLQDRGYVVTSFTKSEKALAAFLEHPHDYDAVISDQTMPILSGKELVQKIKHIRHDIPVILISGFSETHTEETLQEIGVNAFLSKPTRINEICRVLHNIFSS
jgi:signal transduction histidine kinase/ligand-binding sensor domain-containing protein/CheY-like chemotaxis protein